MIVNIVKGTRIRARWLATTNALLAGSQFKTGAVEVEIVGIVRHLRGDHPTDPQQVVLYVEVEGEPAGVTRERPFGCKCDGHDQLVRVNPNHIVEVMT